MKARTSFLVSTTFVALLALSMPARAGDWSFGFSFDYSRHHRHYAPRTYVYYERAPRVAYRYYAPRVVYAEPLPRVRHYYRDYAPRRVVYRDYRPSYYCGSRTYVTRHSYPSSRVYRHSSYAPAVRTTRIHRR